MQIEKNKVKTEHVACVFLGYLTTRAIDSPASLGWRRLQAELKKADSKMNYGFMFKFAEVLYNEWILLKGAE